MGAQLSYEDDDGAPFEARTADMERIRHEAQNHFNRLSENGTLNANQLHTALSRLGLVERAGQSRKIFAHFDSATNKHPTGLILSVFIHLVESAHMYKFVEEQSNSGLVDYVLCQRALELIGLTLDDKQPLKRYDPLGKGHLEITEFIALADSLRRLQTMRMAQHHAAVKRPPMPNFIGRQAEPESDVNTPMKRRLSHLLATGYGGGPGGGRHRRVSDSTDVSLGKFAARQRERRDSASSFFSMLGGERREGSFARLRRGSSAVSASSLDAAYHVMSGESFNNKLERRSAGEQPPAAADAVIGWQGSPPPRRHPTHPSSAPRRPGSPASQRVPLVRSMTMSFFKRRPNTVSA